MASQPFSIIGSGVVLPPGVSAKRPLPEGPLVVRIDGHDESGLVRCVYPCLVRCHQADTVAELAGKVVSQLRALYGPREFAFESVPDAVAAGQSFTVKG